MTQAPPPPAPPYGTNPTPNYGTPGGAGGPPTSGKAIGSLVCGILSLGTCCIPLLSIPLGIVAVVLGVMGKSDADAGRASGRGLALAGLITGGIGALLSILLWIAAAVGGPQLGDFLQRKATELEQKAQQQQNDAGTSTDTDTDTGTDTETDPRTPATPPPATPAPAPQ